MPDQRARKAAAVVLAAGSSSRMGASKVLMEVRGAPLVRHAIRAAEEGGCSPIVVVTGANAVEVERALSGTAAVAVRNSRWREGAGTSIDKGIDAVENEPDVAAAVILLADQPLVTGRTVRCLMERWRSTQARIVASSYAGVHGVPALFARSLFPLLRALTTTGAQRIIEEHISELETIEAPEAAVDIDTPADLERFR